MAFNISQWCCWVFNGNDEIRIGSTSSLVSVSLNFDVSCASLYRSNLYPPVFLQQNLPKIRVIVTLQVLSLTKIWGADIDTVRLWCSFASWNIIRPSFKYIWFDTLETLSKNVLQILQHGHRLHGGPEVIPYTWPFYHQTSTFDRLSNQPL